MRRVEFATCLATRGSAVPAGPDWIHEIKNDGYRLTVHREGKRVRLFTRNGHDWSYRYSLIVEAALRIRIASFVLDGEAVLLGVDGRSDFDGLHSRRHDDEVQFYAFNVLMSEDDDLRKLPLSMRKASLARLLARRVSGIFLSEFERGEIGPDLFRHARMLGLKGLVSRRDDRAYRASVSANWVKVKNPEHPAKARVEGRLLMRPIPRGKYLDARHRRSASEAADSHIRCSDRGGSIDVSDLGSVVDYTGPLPRPAIDQPQ